jgi:hypothetical protein
MNFHLQMANLNFCSYFFDDVLNAPMTGEIKFLGQALPCTRRQLTMAGFFGFIA